MSMIWSWRLLRAGSFRLDGGGMFGVVPKVLWSKMVEPDERNRIPLQTNCLLLEGLSAVGLRLSDGEDSRQPTAEGSHAPGHRQLNTDDRQPLSDRQPPAVGAPPGGSDGPPTTGRGQPLRVLIETGFGDKWSDKERDIFAIERRTVVDALAEVGVTPEQINLVIVSHLHFDHAAGLTRVGEGTGHQASGTGQSADGGADVSGAGVSPAIVPTFPNARIIVQKREWEDALANRSTMTRTYLRDHLDPIADRVILVDGETEIDERIPGIPGRVSGLTVWPLPGHTWGQQGIRFRDAAGVVAFIGDVIPTINHVGLAFSIGYDMEPYTNMQTKRGLLDRACREGWRLALDHEPGPHPVVRVAAHPERAGQWLLKPAALP